MASPVTHAVGAITAAIGFRVRPASLRYWWLGIACAEAPDLDAIGFWLGVPYGSLLGHRGLTHSIVFGMLLSAIVSAWAARSGDMGRTRLWWYLLVATLSHGVLDAMTDGGLGVAFLSPFDQTRYFAPFRPIPVASMSLWDLLGPHGARVLLHECLWVWIPCGLFAVVFRLHSRGNRIAVS